MNINDSVQFTDQSPQSLAVAGEIGVITATESRDGTECANVTFSTYGAEFTGIAVSRLAVVG